jgi:hypothetical protein
MYHTLGLWRTLLLSPWWQVKRKYLVLLKDLQRSEPPSALSKGRGLTSLRWTRMTEADIPRMQAMNPRISEAEIRRRWGEDRWDTTRPAYLPYLRKTFRPLEGDILTSESFTRRELRGRGIHSLSWALALRRARDSGMSRSITLVAWWNGPSLRVNLDKTKRQIAGTAGYWQVGIFRWHFITGLVRCGADGNLFVVREAARNMPELEGQTP